VRLTDELGQGRIATWLSEKGVSPAWDDDDEKQNFLTVKANEFRLLCFHSAHNNREKSMKTTQRARSNRPK
jgi:hypothetical protein